MQPGGLHGRIGADSQGYGVTYRAEEDRAPKERRHPGHTIHDPVTAVRINCPVLSGLRGQKRDAVRLVTGDLGLSPKSSSWINETFKIK